MKRWPPSPRIGSPTRTAGAPADRRSTARTRRPAAARPCDPSPRVDAADERRCFRRMILGFGPLPAEFTSNGMIQVSQYTTLRRALLVGKAAGAKFVFVTLAYEGGVLIGAVVNKFLPEETKAAIGGSS